MNSLVDYQTVLEARDKIIPEGIDFVTVRSFAPWSNPCLLLYRRTDTQPISGGWKDAAGEWFKLVVNDAVRPHAWGFIGNNLPRTLGATLAPEDIEAFFPLSIDRGCLSSSDTIDYASIQEAILYSLNTTGHPPVMLGAPVRAIVNKPIRIDDDATFGLTFIGTLGPATRTFSVPTACIIRNTNELEQPIFDIQLSHTNLYNFSVENFGGANTAFSFGSPDQGVSFVEMRGVDVVEISGSTPLTKSCVEFLNTVDYTHIDFCSFETSAPIQIWHHAPVGDVGSTYLSITNTIFSIFASAPGPAAYAVKFDGMGIERFNFSHNHYTHNEDQNTRPTYVIDTTGLDDEAHASSIRFTDNEIELDHPLIGTDRVMRLKNTLNCLVQNNVLGYLGNGDYMFELTNSFIHIGDNQFGASFAGEIVKAHDAQSAAYFDSNKPAIFTSGLGLSGPITTRTVDAAGTYSISGTANVGPARDIVHQFIVEWGGDFTIAFLQNGLNYMGHGQEFSVEIVNNSGGALGAITWAGFKMSAWTNPANQKRRTITFYWDEAAGEAVEKYRSSADVPV